MQSDTQYDLLEQYLARGGNDQGAVNVMRQLSEQIATLKEEKEHYKKLAFTDSLTGLLNRTGYEEIVREHFKQDGNAEEKRTPRNEHIVFMFVDLDGFKAINDTYGHKAGDIALQEVGKYLATQVRDTDVVLARKGGDEFLAILQGTDKDHAYERIIGIENGLNDISFEYKGKTIKVGGSIGAIDYNPTFTIEENVTFADQAMMERKGDRKRKSYAANMTADDFNRANTTSENTILNGQSATTTPVTKFDPRVRTLSPF